MKKSKLLQLGAIVILLFGVFLVNGCSLKEKMGKITNQENSHPCPKEAVERYVESEINKTRGELEGNRLPGGIYLRNKREIVEHSISYKEGEKISNYSIVKGEYAICPYGEEEGENVNYLYCSSSPSIFKLKKKVISKEGEIKKIIRWDIKRLVIDPKKWEVLSVKCKKPKNERS